jgi:hypothetical protein
MKFRSARTIFLMALLPAVLGAGLVIGRTPAAAQSSQSAGGGEAPAYDSSGQVMMPANYRDWVWLSSGLGMSYNDGVGGAVERARRPNFTNVFVNPSSYRSFQQTGTWPDKTTLVLEIRGSETTGSINKGGQYQGGVRALEVEVKDKKKFPGNWAFFSVKVGEDRGTQFPASAECYSCHAQNGAVDNTFVQFYPTLAEVARRKGTFRESSEQK